MTMRVLSLLALLLTAPLLADGAAAQCERVAWRTYQGTPLWRLADADSVYFFATRHMAVDADGAPNAYHPDNTGLDDNRNAGYPHGGWRSVLVADPVRPDRPYVQSSGEFAGYFVSKTSLQDRSLPETDVRRYVDARTVPYLVFPGSFYRLRGTGRLGDLGAAYNLSDGSATPFVVADVGPRNAALGEVSIGLAEALGGTDVNPRSGAGMPAGEFVYVVFPYSHATPAWPRTQAELQARVEALMTGAGGWERLLACFE